MNFPSKAILIIAVTVLTLSHSSISNGKEVESNLTGKWVGSALLYATANGFISSKDVIKLNIYQQEKFEFKGSIERSYNGNTLLQDIQGYLDSNKRNICLVGQKNRDVIIGYVTSNEIMKLYIWENSESNAVTVYILRKTKAATN